MRVVFFVFFSVFQRSSALRIRVIVLLRKAEEDGFVAEEEEEEEEEDNDNQQRRLTPATHGREQRRINKSH